MSATNGGKGTTRKMRVNPEKQQNEAPRGSTMPHTYIQTYEDDEDFSSSSSENNSNYGARKMRKQYHNATHARSESNSKTQEKRQKPNPIIVIDTKFDVLKKLFEGIKCNYKLMKIGVRIDVCDTENHIKAEVLLRSKKIPYYLYHTGATRPIKIVLFGLEIMKDEDLMQKLENAGIKPEKIRKLTLKRPLYENQGVYLLFFKPMSVTLQNLRSNHKVVDNIAVRWERFRPRKFDKVAQCRNCQRLGHSSDNCHAASRCVLCAEFHKSIDCPKKIPRDQLKDKQSNAGDEPLDRSFVKCVLCSGNHTSNYLGCKQRKEYLKVQNTVVRANESKRRNTRNVGSKPQANLNSLSNMNMTSLQPSDNIMMKNMESIMTTMQVMVTQMNGMMTMFMEFMGKNSVMAPSIDSSNK